MIENLREYKIDRCRVRGGGRSCEIGPRFGLQQGGIFVSGHVLNGSTVKIPTHAERGFIKPPISLSTFSLLFLCFWCRLQQQILIVEAEVRQGRHRGHACTVDRAVRIQ